MSKQREENSVVFDLWQHRSRGMTCATCMYFVPKKPIEAPVLRPEDARTLGRCRRHAPDCQKGWPAVFAFDWCGDHKLDENKI